jgi:hypothetical protein
MAGALAVSLVFGAAGCGKRPMPSNAEPSGKRATPSNAEPSGSADIVKITIHVKNMTKALNIT